MMRSLDPEIQARLGAFQQYKIKHPHLEEIDHLLMNAIQEHTSYSLLACMDQAGSENPP